MRGFAAVLALAGLPWALAVAVQPQPAKAQPPRGFGGAVCVLFEHADYAGAQLPVYPGRDSAFVGDAWNDRISAVTCRPGCALIAFEHSNYQGERRLFLGRTAFVGEAWNDRISSYISACS